MKKQVEVGICIYDQEQDREIIIESIKNSSMSAYCRVSRYNEEFETTEWIHEWIPILDLQNILERGE